MGKYGTTRQGTDDNITRRMRLACWITRVTDTRLNCFSTATIVTRGSQFYFYTYITCLVSVKVDSKLRVTATT